MTPKTNYSTPSAEVLELRIGNDVLTTSNMGGNASTEDYFTNEI